MADIRILDKNTIDQIAAGEVVERPMNVVKELVENAIDAGADAITVEITDGGISFLRVTDNGEGIPSSQVRDAFKRHATSKITDIEDLAQISTLGFRGEALSSIAAVSQVDLITKTKTEVTGTRYCVNGGEEVLFEEIGAPDGTTFIARHLFYNLPVRKKFLRSPKTEASYVADLMEHLALSHPAISFHFVMNRKEKFHTSGNGDEKELIYRLYGKDTATHVQRLSASDGDYKLEGFLGEPLLNRSNRNFEQFFVNGRFVRDTLLQRALEEGYREYLMQHKFPFAILHVTLPQSEIDVNVHPTKMELKFHDRERMYRFVTTSVFQTLAGNEMIPDLPPDDKKIIPLHTDSVAGTLIEKREERQPEPFEVKRMQEVRREAPVFTGKILGAETGTGTSSNIIKGNTHVVASPMQQMELFDEEERVLSEGSVRRAKVLAQVFKTYWLFELDDNLYFVDQHAAHEKVNYERFLKRYQSRSLMTQSLNPPVIVSLSAKEEAMFTQYADYFHDLGFQAEPFGEKDVAIHEIPLDLFGAESVKDLFLSILDDLSEERALTDPKVITQKIASMACKASVKGNTSMTQEEMEALLNELLTLDNPYNCPHGRPTIITMSKAELDKRFKRIVE